MNSKIFYLLLLFFPICASAQQPVYKVDTLVTKKGVSFRGLSVVDDNTVWVSGSRGTVGRSVDGGTTWNWYTVEGYEKVEFRDIEAFDAQNAVIMGIGSPGYILRTHNGGGTWKLVYENRDTAMFMDAMAFWNIHSGIAVGDPINGKLFVTRSFDGGKTWKDIPLEHRPVADSGEAMFASSGTNVRPLDLDEAVIVTGGLAAHLYIRDQRIPLPIMKGTQTSGANSVAVKTPKKRKKSTELIIVGGDFMRDTVTTGNCIYTTDLGKTWQTPVTPPHGYRSCVEYFGDKKIIACGTSGVDVSVDGGKHFTLVTKEGYHVCLKAKNGKAVFLAGNGKVAVLRVGNK